MHEENADKILAGITFGNTPKGIFRLGLECEVFEELEPGLFGSG